MARGLGAVLAPAILLTAMSATLASAQTYGPYPEQTFKTCGDLKSHTAVAIMHGGWNLTDNSPAEVDVDKVCAYVASHGAFGITFGYRLTPTSGWPAQLQDAQLMVRWLRYHGYKEVGAVGLSSGAYNMVDADLVQKTLGNSATDPRSESALYPLRSSSPDWVVAISPFSDLTDPTLYPAAIDGLIRNLPFTNRNTAQIIASPISRVRSDAAPMIVIHGTADTVVPMAQSEQLTEAIEKVGGRVTFVKTPYRHVFQALTPYQIHTILNWVGACIAHSVGTVCRIG
jgi:acetyl esterase/lipase